MKNITITTAIYFICLYETVFGTEYTRSAVTEQGGSIFAVAPSGNAFYIGGRNDQRIYRYEMLQELQSPTSQNIQTTHTLDVDVMAISNDEYYIATGARDYRIQLRIIKNNTLVCTLWHHNQVKALVFNPVNEKILYSAAMDDKIRKWNISTCKADAEIQIPESVTSMDIDPTGTKLAYGTLYGDVGYVDHNLTSLTNVANGHMFCVISTFYTYPDYYVTVGHESAIVLWKDGVEIDRLKNVAQRVLTGCSMVVKSRYNETFRSLMCYRSTNRVYLFKITNTTVSRFTDHGFYKTPQILIAAHMEVTSLEFIIGQSNRLYYNFIYDEDNQECSPHTGKNLVKGVCEFCWYFIEGCHFCDDDTNNNRCTTCMQGTFSDGNPCTSCSDDCIDCWSLTGCSTCAPGYYKSGGSCIAETSPLNGCYQLRSGGNGCDSITRGFKINGINHRFCNNARQGCLQCSGNQCQGCETGYYLQTNNCQACNATISGCIACANSSDCIKCQVAFKYSGANLHCSDCHYTCLTCGQFYDTCVTCSDGLHHRWLNGTACQCKDGYYDNGVAECALCSDVLNYCYKCNNDNICLQCQANYFMVTSGGITECEECNQYCETCEGTSDNCISCNQLTYMRQLSGNSCVCMSGYVSLLGSIPCYQCSTLNDGCNDCTNQTYCNNCDIGYFLKTYNATHRLCSTCPYYCPDCSQNGVSYVCNSCGATRQLVNGQCTCITGYFDDNMTQICQKCSDVIQNCEECISRHKCLKCAANMYPDESFRICNPCRPTCKTCGVYFTQCTSCDASQNRILIDGQCACEQFAYEDNGVCTLCQTVIPNCNSCENPYLCTGCKEGFTLQEDLKACIDCAAEISGCIKCTSKTKCTQCQDSFYQINDKCRCDNSKYTSTDNWGQCINYTIPGLSSSLGIQSQVYQHQNNSINVFIRFRAKVLTILNNQTIQESIALFIDNEEHPITYVYIDNNKINIQTTVKKAYYDAEITIIFAEYIFFNEKLLTLNSEEKTLNRRRLYYTENSTTFLPYIQMKEVMTVMFYVLKWIFFGFTIIGIGHLIYPIVTITQLLPIFLFINMSLPKNITALLQSMLSFQVPSIIPLLQINSGITVFFPPINYDYYFLRDYIAIGKIGDFILILLVNILTKFDDGIVRMFPPGQIRRYLYETLVRKGYSTMSICILSLQPSMLILAGVYINYAQWQVMGEVFNYCCCMFIFGFYLAYNFNHASNLMGSKQLRNIDNQNCYYQLNHQEPESNNPVFLILICDIWLTGALFLVGPFPYFIGSFILILARIIAQTKPKFYIGTAQMVIRIIQNICFFTIYVLMFVFYLAESYFVITFEEADQIGLALLVLILLYIFLTIAEKIVYHRKLGATWMKTKKVANARNDDVIFAQKVEQGEQQDNSEDNNQDDDDFKNRAFMKSNNKIPFNNTIRTNKNDSNVFDDSEIPVSRNSNHLQPNSNTFKPTNYKGLQPNSSIYNPNQSALSPNNYAPYRSDNFKNQSMYNQTRKGAQMDTKSTTDQYFKNKNKKSGEHGNVRIKSANTSKYAQNHLQLRYKANQLAMQKPIDQFEDY